MPITNIQGFGSRSYMSARVKTNTLTPTAVSLAFLPTVHRVRKARLQFTAPATADTYDITVEFTDSAFEEFELSGEKKEKEE